MRRRTLAVAAVPAAVVLATSAHAAGRRISPLTLVPARTPTFHVLRYETHGSYPQVRGAGLDLRAVNASLRAAVIAEQRAFAPYARREKPTAASPDPGVFRTVIDRRYVSASTLVVSAMLPLTEEVFPGQNGGDTWLGMTVRVPSGVRVNVTDLFTDSQQGLRVLARASLHALRRDARVCVSEYPFLSRPTVKNYSTFALTPSGLAVGFPEHAACYRLATTVPYAVLRPYLSKLGVALTAAVRHAR